MTVARIGGNAELPGIERPDLQALPQIGDRMTFLYLEHCSVSREDGAVLVKDDAGRSEFRPLRSPS